jgi:protease I
MAEVLMVLPPERFRDEELLVTRGVLESAGHRCVVASTRTGTLVGSRGGSVGCEVRIDSESASAYGAVVFVGGGGSRLLWDNADAHRLAREALGQGRVLGALCLAPVILARAGVLSGRRATVAGTESASIEEAGASYAGPGVTVDGLIVTANGPKSSAAFGERIVELLDSGRA